MSNAEAGQALLARPSPDLKEIEAILADIVAADERAGQVIRRLREMLKRSAPSRRLQDLAGIVQGVLEFLGPDLQRRGVAVEFSDQASTRRVDVDRVPIEQVIINLITNACDAMADNTPGDRPLEVILDDDGDNARVRIIDAGSGLPESPERVFDPFYTTKADGLGMGLAIARSIVMSHGGRLWAERNASRGTTLTFTVPFATKTS